MPSVENINANEIKVISKIESDTLSGFKAVSPSVSSVGSHRVLGVTPTNGVHVHKSADVSSQKSKIVLHQTVGVLSGDLNALTSQNYMSTSYLIARTGDIIEIWNPKYWSYHLGKSAVGGNTLGSTKSIAIELSNYGPLDYKSVGGEDVFMNVYGSKFATGNERMNEFGIVDSGGIDPVVTKLQNAYRGYLYFASPTEAQYNALRDLLSYLELRHTIPHNFIEYSRRFAIFGSKSEAQKFEGVCSHVNFRPSGKWDIGPAFKWDKITDKSSDDIKFTENTEENLSGLEMIDEEKYDGDDNFEYTDTVNPLTGEVIEFASAKKIRILKVNNPLLCGF